MAPFAFPASKLFRFDALLSLFVKLLKSRSLVMEGRAKHSLKYRPPGPVSRAMQDYNHFMRLSKQEATGDIQSITMIRKILAKSSKPRICVVGAGVAGLRCAQVLSKGGCNVTILEARDRVGGRVRLSQYQ